MSLKLETYFKLSKINKICRVCLLESEELVSIFDEISYSEEEHISYVFYRLLENILSKQVTIDNKYPLMICKYCLKNAISAFHFKQKLEKSEQLLKSYIQQQTEEYAEPPEAIDCVTEIGKCTDDTDVSNMLIKTENENEENANKSSLIYSRNNERVQTNAYPDLKEREKKDVESNLNLFTCTVCKRQYNRIQILNGVCKFCSQVKLETTYKCKELYLANTEKSTDEEEQSVQSCDFQNDDLSDDSSDDYVEDKKMKNKPKHPSKQTKYAFRINEKLEKIYYCTICKREFKLACSLVLHMRTHTNQSFPCKICNKDFQSSDNLKTHMKTHGKPNPYLCAVCDQQFMSLEELKIHTIVHTKQKFGSKNTQISSSTCETPVNKQLKNLIKTKRKRINHPFTINEQNEKVYSCPVCEKEYNRSFALTTHMRLHSTETSFLCYLCGKGFHTSGSLTRHMLTHTDLRPYACKLCPKKYKQLIGLKSHMRGHTGERPYLCSVCGKGFKQNSELKCHTRYHTQEKPYECNVCGKRTAMQSHMKQHMRTHTGEKPYVCRICGKHFGDSGSVKQHEMAHSGVKPYICKICKKAFGRPNSLRTHYKMHNKDKATSA